MKSVKAKFKCDSVEHFKESKKAKFSPVMGYHGENADFTKLTPSGYLEIYISDETPAAEMFEPGKDYYLEFTPAED